MPLAIKRLPILLLSLIAAVCYNLWIFQRWLNPGLAPAWSFISEYGSPTQPYSWAFRLGDIATGLILLCIVLLLKLQSGQRGSGKSGPAERRGASRLKIARFSRLSVLVCIVGFCVCTVLDAVFPMSCPLSVTSAEALLSAQCLTISNTIHEVTSTGAGVCAIAAILMWWIGRRGSEGAYLQIGERLAFLSGAAHVVSALYTFAGVFLHFIPMIGYAQRVSVLALSIWWVLLVGGASENRASDNSIR